MLYSAEGEPATKGGTGHCPFCGETLIPRCGDIKIHHWAHQKRQACDDWSESETQWHLQWKVELAARLPHSDVKVEQVLSRAGTRHIADVYCARSNFVIELQHSPLALEALRAREAFYGRMMWIVDVSDTDFNGNISPVLGRPHPDLAGYSWFHWYYLRSTWAHATVPLLLDGYRNVYLTLGVDGMQRGFYAKKLPRTEFLDGLGKHLKAWRACVRDVKLPKETEPLLPEGWYRVRLTGASGTTYSVGATLTLTLETVDERWGRFQKPHCFEVFVPLYRPEVCLNLLELFLGPDADGFPLPEALQEVRRYQGECILAHVVAARRTSAGGTRMERNTVIALKICDAKS